MRVIERNIASPIIVSRDGKIFLAKKSLGDVWQGTWTIPGGGIDAGETREQAMVRETLEETGINLAGFPAELIDVGSGESLKKLKDTGEEVIAKMTFYDFRVVIDRNAADVEVHIAKEFSEYGWFDVIDLPSMTLSPSCEKLFRKVGYLT